ncbi:hypothetical protein PPERSA_05678 [Pseudocohnilembus persalinus]|uniref:Uncharacterized protein n=1 Tax=Pseudocohnilembus persalinus TaxID=266149 RepID=A0A0V0QMN9_PSEPJ|nr:hypothetical protein PPERSA_05678 [Pseudocohnilembus persalinus]|eukprot:KRX03320.1 hypothetical protein PPERSA_05678 [Pseudocohnilembus persalinus]
MDASQQSNFRQTLISKLHEKKGCGKIGILGYQTSSRQVKCGTSLYTDYRTYQEKSYFCKSCTTKLFGQQFEQQEKQFIEEMYSKVNSVYQFKPQTQMQENQDEDDSYYD